MYPLDRKVEYPSIDLSIEIIFLLGMFHFDVLLLYMEEPQMRIEVVVPGVQLFNILCSILGLRQVVRSENTDQVRVEDWNNKKRLKRNMTEILTAPGAQVVWCQDMSSLISQRTCFKLNNKCVLGLGSLYVLASLTQGKSAVVSRENADGSDGYPLSSAPPQWDGGDQSDSNSFSLSTHLSGTQISIRKTLSPSMPKCFNWR